MHIKSWQIALAGNIPFLGMILIMLFLVIKNGYDRNTFSILIAIIFGSVVVLTPIMLLKCKNQIMNKIGGLISIFVGLLLILYMLNIFSHATGPDLTSDDLLNITALIPFLSAIAFLMAGVNYFKTENKPQL